MTIRSGGDVCNLKGHHTTADSQLGISGKQQQAKTKGLSLQHGSDLPEDKERVNP